MTGVRLDKWLWAARFFKTRARAKEAIDGGKVHVNGSRGKASKSVTIGDELQIRQGYDEKTVIVLKTSDQRRGAPEAQLMYEETEASIAGRMLVAEQRKAAGSFVRSEHRPNKRDRRLIHQFKDKNLQ